jgi:virulence-associated protein VapD
MLYLVKYDILCFTEVQGSIYFKCISTAIHKAVRLGKTTKKCSWCVSNVNWYGRAVLWNPGFVQ